MKSINQAMVLGNLTKDPELRYTPNGHPVMNFSIATNREWFDKNTQEKKEAVEFHNIVFWGKAAEILAQYVSKGNKLLVQGRLQTRNWEDKNGVKRYITEIVGRDFVLLTPKPKTEEVRQPVKVRQPESLKESTSVPEMKPVKSTDVVNPEEIPF